MAGIADSADVESGFMSGHVVSTGFEGLEPRGSYLTLDTWNCPHTDQPPSHPTVSKKNHPPGFFAAAPLPLSFFLLATFLSHQHPLCLFVPKLPTTVKDTRHTPASNTNKQKRKILTLRVATPSHSNSSTYSTYYHAGPFLPRQLTPSLPSYHPSLSQSSPS